MLRRLVLWMLLLALPLQAAAAAPGLHCLHGHAGSVAAAHDAVPAPARALTARARLAGSHAMPDAAASAPQARAHACDGAAQPAAGHACSACHHGCCAGHATSAPPAPAAPGVTRTVARALPAGARAYLSVVPDTPRRPPRRARVA